MIWKTCVLISVALCVLGDRRPATSRQRVEHRISVRHGDLSHIGHQKPEHHEEYAWAYPSYEFSYEVDDPHTHDIKGHHESRDGDKVRGYYWLIQPNGHKRLVKYRADDKNGFTADVHYLKLEGHDYEKTENKEVHGQGGEKDGQGNEGQGEEEQLQSEEQNNDEQTGQDEQQEQGEQEAGGEERDNNEGRAEEERVQEGKDARESRSDRDEKVNRKGKGGRGRNSDSELGAERREDGEKSGEEQNNGNKGRQEDGAQEKKEEDLWLGLRSWSKVKHDLHRKEHEDKLRQKGAHGQDVQRQEGGQEQNDRRAQEPSSGREQDVGQGEESPGHGGREQDSQGHEGSPRHNHGGRHYGGIWKGLEIWNKEGLSHKNERQSHERWSGKHERITALAMIGDNSENDNEGRGIGDNKRSDRRRDDEERRGQSSRHQYQYKPIPYGQRLY